MGHKEKGQSAMAGLRGGNGSDGKNFCLARLTLQKSYCYSTRVNDTKRECVALFR